MDNTNLEIFSYYTQIQSDFLVRFSKEIFDELATAFTDESEIDCDEFNDIYGKIWLWILGAYEIVRTIDQAKDSFSEDLHPKINETKILLA